MRELFAHLHLGSPVERRGTLWVDAAGDQAPFADHRGSEPQRPAFAAVSWRADDAEVADRCWRVSRTVALGVDAVLAPASTDSGVIKQVSLVRRAKGIDRAAFAERYRAHVEIVKAHHGVARYAQSLAVEPVYGIADDADGDSDDIDGISELWFASRADWRDRFFLHPASRDVVMADAGRFLDFATTCSILADELSPAAPG